MTGTRLGSALSLVAAVVLLLAGLLPALTVISRDTWTELLQPGPASLDTLVTGIAAPLALGLAGWLLLAVLVSTAQALLVLAGRTGQSRAASLPDLVSSAQPAGAPPRWWVRALAPSLVRHGVAALIGVVLLSAPAAASDLGTGAGTGAGPAVTAPARTPGPPPAEYRLRGWLPSVPAPPGAPGSQPGADRARQRAGAGIHLVTSAGNHRRADDDDMVVVHRGDTLWSIAARSLGTDATDAEIAQEWPHWFRANREVVGSDPDRLEPGQRLRPPANHGGAR